MSAAVVANPPPGSLQGLPAMRLIQSLWAGVDRLLADPTTAGVPVIAVSADAAVQQCYRVSPGPDFVLVVFAPDMPGYLALAQRLFTSDANVRNVKAFFSVKRSKFEPYRAVARGA